MKVTAFIRKTSAKNNVTNLARVYFRVRDIGGVDIKAASELSINPNTIQRAYMQLEQEGLIYPVKGTVNFIADSEEVRKLSKASYIKELKTLIQKGKAMGMEAEELIYIIRECYKEEKP